MTTFASLAARARSAEQIDTLVREGELESCAFAMGCFWAPDARFGALAGVVRTRVGYAGGTRPRPSYRAIGDHAEAVQVEFDPRILSFDALFEHFRQWHRPRPRHVGQYRPAIFPRGDAQVEIARAWAASLEPNCAPQLAVGSMSDEDSVARFWDAEDYHQKYGLRRNAEAVAALEAAFGARWDASDLATDLNGRSREELQHVDWS